MKNFTRKVVILENLTSPYVQQAIIVLNDYNPANEAKVIYDAEKIVNDYLKKNGYTEYDNTKVYNSKKYNKKKNNFIFSALTIGIIIASILLYTLIN